MPSTTTFTFKHKTLNYAVSNIEVKSFGYNDALNILARIVKNALDWQLV